MSNDTGFSAIAVGIKSNKLSKTIFHEVVGINKLIENCQKILDYEKNTLNADRSNQSIGLPPSLIHAYEAVSYADQIEDPKNSYAAAVTEYMVGQVELIFQLLKPSVVVLFTNPTHSFTYSYISSFNFEAVYVPNDEYLFRSENILEQQECPFNVVSKLSLINGEIPNDTDLLVADVTDLSSYVDMSILENIYENMKSGSAILLYNNNDFYTYYANNDEFSEDKMDHPIFDINQSIKNLPNCNYYHIGSTAGVTIIIKKW